MNDIRTSVWHFVRDVLQDSVNETVWNDAAIDDGALDAVVDYVGYIVWQAVESVIDEMMERPQ